MTSCRPASLLPFSPADSSLFPLSGLSYGSTLQNTHWKTRYSKPFLFTDVREARLYRVGLLSRGTCGGGPALLQQGSCGAQPSLCCATGEDFEMENPL